MNLMSSPRFEAKFDPRLAAINHRNRAHYREQQKVLDRLLKPGPILDFAFARLSYTISLLRTCLPPKSALEQLRRARLFEQELLDADRFLKETRFAKAQAKRASEERVKIGDNRTSLVSVIRELIRSPELRDMSPKDLWPHFHAKLEKLECSPVETTRKSGNRRFDCIKFEYYKQGKVEPTVRPITLGNFRRIVARLRKEVQ
jgi:hypothetical protein